MLGLGNLEELLSRAQAASDRANAQRVKQAQQAEQAAQQAQQRQPGQQGAEQARDGQGAAVKSAVDPARQDAARNAAMKQATGCHAHAEPQWDTANGHASRAADGQRAAGTANQRGDGAADAQRRGAADNPAQRGEQPTPTRRAQRTQRRARNNGPRDLQKGMSGEDVRQLQRRLNQQGARLQEDGRFGRKTERAVREAQRRAGIATDGIVGPDTRGALQRAEAAPPSDRATQDAQRTEARPGRRPPGTGQTERDRQTGQAPRNDPTGGQRPGGADRVQPGGAQTQDTSTVAGAARFLLNSPNVSFWNGLSTGSDRKNLERLARGERAMVDARGRQVNVNPRMMQALVEMAKRGPIQINALTGGVHSHNSQHYVGNAVDLSVRVGNARQIEEIARQFGGRRNHERTHIHLSF